MNTTQANPVRGILFMVVTGLCFVGVTVTVKLLHGRVPAAESAFLRYLLGLVFLIPMWKALRELRMTPRQWRLSALRGGAQTLGVICWFFAMARIPLAEVTAMNYLTPIYVTVLAVFVLGERLAMRRIIAARDPQADPRADVEYTDWPALDALIDDWMGAAGGG